MARRGGDGGGGGGGMAAPLIGVAIALLTFVILEIFAPTIAGTIQGAQPSLPVTSDWNNTYRTSTAGGSKTAIPSGADTWTTVVQIIGVVFLIIAIAIAIYYLKSV